MEKINWADWAPVIGMVAVAVIGWFSTRRGSFSAAWKDLLGSYSGILNDVKEEMKVIREENAHLAEQVELLQKENGRLVKLVNKLERQVIQLGHTPITEADCD